MSDTPTRENVAVAVITGAHGFEVPPFHELFRSIPGIDAYVMTLEDWVADLGDFRRSSFYDVVVFYNFHQADPESHEHPMADVRGALEGLPRSGPGIFVLHHAILAYPGWPFWSELVGIDDRSFGYHGGQSLRVEAAAEHPITAGTSAWDLIDETYTMADAGAGSEILLTTDHEHSMRTLAWTRTVGDARVFCLQSGHDRTSFDDPDFRRIVGRGIHWLAGRI